MELNKLKEDGSNEKKDTNKKADIPVKEGIPAKGPTIRESRHSIIKDSPSTIIKASPAIKDSAGVKAAITDSADKKASPALAAAASSKDKPPQKVQSLHKVRSGPIKQEIKRDPSKLLPDVKITPGHPTPPPVFKPSDHDEQPKRKWWKFCYDRENKTCCDRSLMSWLYIFGYSIFYLIFLCTYTLIFLYFSLLIVKSNKTYDDIDSLVLSADYNSIGLTVAPTSVNKMSLISYEDGNASDYAKYVAALKSVISRSQPNIVRKLGPCSAAPFGYGDNPCVIIKINSHYSTVGVPLKLKTVNTSDVPSKVKLMAIKESKLWLICSGSNPYDTEHIGTIKYYPEPPGFAPGAYTPANNTNQGLIAVQFSNFTKGMALAIECSLYYEGGKSTVDFVLYVSSSIRKT